MSYRSRVARDLDSWIEDGLVDKTNREAILARLPSARPGWSAAGAAAILGAVLLALAALSFVAANWADMARIARFAVILGALWAAYGGSALAFARKNEAVGHALALLGAALFGAAIMLTAQTFNMSAFRNTGVLIWTGGALATALLLPSRPVLILAALLGAAWVWLESVNPFAPDIIWSYLAVWLVTALAAHRLRSRVSVNLISLGLLIWLGFAVWTGAEAGLFAELEMLALFVLVCGAIALFASTLQDRDVFGAGVLTGWAAAAGIIAGWAIQFPVADFADGSGASLWMDSDGQWERVFGIEGGAFLVPGLIAAAAIAGLAVWRRARGALSSTALISILAAAATALLLPFLARWAGIEMMLPLRFALGTVIYALGVGLILQGAREGRRLIGGIGIVLFIAQSLYVYASLFGDLLGTAVFFFIGGLLLIGVSIAVTRVQARLTRTPADKGDAS